MDFFIDRNVPEALARMLGHYDRNHNVIYHDDRFEKTATDTHWLGEIAAWDPVPVVVTGDGRILRNPAELQVLRRLPLTFFIFAGGWMKMTWHDRAWKTIRNWPAIVKNAEPRRPTIYRVPVSANKVELLSLTADAGGRK